MAPPYATTADDLEPVRTLSGVYPENIRTDASAASWGTIVTRDAATVALGVSSATFGVTTILWVTLSQLVAAAMGGYLADKLRKNRGSTRTHLIVRQGSLAQRLMTFPITSRSSL